MILFQENGALKAEIELMKEKLEQTIKLLENMEIKITKLKATIKTNSAAKNSNGNVLQEYLEKVNSLCEEAIDVERRQVSNEMNILKLDRETREKLEFIQKSIQYK